MSFYDHARDIFERQYNCTFKLFNLQTVSKEESDSPFDDPYDVSEWVEILSDQPCRISMRTQSGPAKVKAPYAEADLVPYLYCSPLVDIATGSRVEVTDVHGHVTLYELSGLPLNHYVTHQEIQLRKVVKA